MDDTIKEIVEAHTTEEQKPTIVVNGSTAPPIVVTPDGLNSKHILEIYTTSQYKT